ncbi:GTP cyclohydrolase I [Mycobacterium asiaticum]|uniref:GTP cyclohydrolase I n=1 Tax=Mycobacterium asiaticum TaxID=1790 RepID=UPI000A4EA092|nr:GTP cyclohydrolase I [Mycobacterium asiaticum]
MPQTLVRHDHVSRLHIHPGRLELTHPVPFQALCEQHLLPFYGVVRVGYVRGENRLLQTEFIRIVESCSAAVQVQQKMTTRIGLWLHHQLGAPGMGVLVEAGYACTPVRDGAALAGPTTTMAFYGSMRDSAEEQREFLTLARSRGMDRPG